MYLLTSYKYSLRFCSLLIMDAHQLIGFTDKKKFMIVKNNIYYACSGISYLEKFKNGLSLDSVISADLYVEQVKHLYFQSISNSTSIPIPNKIQESSKDDFDSYSSDEDLIDYEDKFYSSRRKQKKDRKKKIDAEINGLF